MMLGGAAALDGVRGAEVQEMMEDRTGSHVLEVPTKSFTQGYFLSGSSGLSPRSHCCWRGESPALLSAHSDMGA